MSANTLIRAKGTTASIRRWSDKADEVGYPGGKFIDHLDGIAIDLQERTGSESVRYGKENNRNTAIAFITPWTLDIKAKDQIVLQGRYWDIQHIRARGRTPMTQQLVAECEETEGSP